MAFSINQTKTPPLWNAFSLGVFTLLLSSLSFANPLSNTADSTISVKGKSVVSTKPDQASINLSASTQAMDSASAKAELDQTLNRFFDELNKIGIQDKSIVAKSIQISPQYEYQNRQQRFIGFQATRAIVVELDDLEKIHPVLDKAVTLNISGIQGVHYSSSKENELRQHARKLAIKDSIQKATDIAKAYGAQLGPVNRILYQAGSTNQPFPVDSFQTRSQALEASPAGGRFIPGDITISDEISVSFSLLH